MCGYAGFIGFSGVPRGELDNLLSRMGRAISHRGPDDYGHWCDMDAQVALVHRRLAVLDLTSAGHQPMVSKSGRFCLVFNGEIYNHLEIRGELSAQGYGPCWTGRSDTETLLFAIESWGFRKTLLSLNGMFSIAIWDSKERTLSLARDRFGQKPLYFGWQKDVFLFGSELKALKCHPAFIGEVDRGAMSLQLRYNYIPSPFSIYKGIKKLSPGTFIQFDLRHNDSGPSSLRPTPYWELQTVISEGRNSRYLGSADQAVDDLDRLLRRAVRRQTLSDVPVGVFLSGGIDSSAIAALIQAQSSRAIQTFSIGIDKKGYDEARYAKEVAQHLGSDHTELYVTARDAIDVIPRMPVLYDEPFSDSSQIPAYFASELAKQKVTVALTGDAGDELFGGYNRYLFVHRFWDVLSRLPVRLRKLGAVSLTALSPDQLNMTIGSMQRLLPAKWQAASLGHKLHTAAGVLSSNSIEDLYLALISHWTDPTSVVIGGFEPETQLSSLSLSNGEMSSVEWMMALDSTTYLPDDILTKVDRAAMGVSLETRLPFLDDEVVEFAWRLPFCMKVREGQGKWLLRQVLYKYVPKAMIERPKMGFGIPIDSWLRGPLRDWANSLLDESRMRHEGFYNPSSIQKMWVEHLSGQRNWASQLWSVLMFQAWLENERIA